MISQKVLRNSYKKYRKAGKGRKRALDFLRSFMPEIIFRTTRLEDEPVTRKMVKSVFG